MKRVFRSILNIFKDNHPTISQDDLRKNYRAFLTSRVDPEDPSFIKIYHWIEAHFREYKEIPAIELLYERAKGSGDEGILATLQDIVKEVPYIGSDYRAVLSEKFEEQNKDKFRSLLTDTWKVVSSGLKVGVGKKKKEIKGLREAIDYFSGESRKYRPISGIKTEGDIRSPEEGKEAIDAYYAKKSDPLTTLGMYTFLQKIDDSCRGFKPGQLIIVAGYVGQAKTILSTNFAYYGVYQGLNGLYITLEMSYDEIRDMFYTLHASAPHWFKHPKYGKLAGKLTYDDIYYGELSDMSEEFYKEILNDFNSGSNNYGHLYLIQPDEKLTPDKLEALAEDYNTRLKEIGEQLDFLVVDYVGLMVPNKSERYGDYNVDLNNIIKRLKNYALTFDGGRKLRVITPFQINRTGWKNALKNDGLYSLSDLSSANESERSADIVITNFFTPEMQKSSMMKIACLKHRKGAIFPPFEVHVDFNTKHIRDFIQTKTEEEGLTEIPVDMQ